MNKDDADDSATYPNQGCQQVQVPFLEASHLMDAFRKSHFPAMVANCTWSLPPCIIVRYPESQTYFELKLSSHAVLQRSRDWMLKHASSTPELILKEQLPATKCQCEEATHLPHHFQVFSSSYSSIYVLNLQIA